ncbi:MAG: hypothetical protein K8I29_06420 [Alphaproteobacteria bacterium]|uniref:Uncharacterized protein n=1 Tax=Candidatus Nitrobium versatile TaxID=2884831 RepID=A0A953M1F0_9BACT|nr:hypothetical protein [Candidatus Nitrobium versatile]
MKKLLKQFETAMMAAAFAEEGAFETARQILKEEKLRKSNRPSVVKRTAQRKELRAD